LTFNQELWIEKQRTGESWMKALFSFKATWILLAWILLMPVLQLGAQQINFADHTGFTSIFDGRTLTNWDGAPEVWRIEDGAIVGESRPDKPAGTTFIIWRGGEPGDFEMKLEIKLEGSGNSGIQYRSRQAEPSANFGPPRQGAPNPGAAPRGPGGRGPGPGAGPYQKWNMQGYQADYDATGNMAGQLFEGGRFPGERGITTRPGQVVLLQSGQQPQVVGMVTSLDELKKSFKPNDWNQYHIIVRGNTFIHILNDRVASVTVDDDPAKRVMKGLIGLQIEGGDLKVSFRNIWLKSLP
jgi:hypothetical protein